MAIRSWEKTFGGSNGDWGWSVHQTTDDGYIFTGYTNSFGAGWNDVYLIKTDSYGNKVWEKTFGGDDDDWGYSVQQTANGGYIVVGTTLSFGASGYDVYLIKIDSDGKRVWEKTFGGSGSDWGRSVHQTTDDGYIFTGYTESFGAGGLDIYLIKLKSISDTTPPTVTKTDPDDNNPSVPVDKTVTITFSEDVQDGDAYDYISFKDASNNQVNVDITPSGNLLVLDPLNSLNYGVAYAVYLPAEAVKNMADIPLADAYSFSFTTMTVQEAVYGINDYIQRLPDNAFKSPAAERTNVYANIFAAIDKMLKTENYQGVIKKLQNDIRSKADYTIDGNPKDDWITDPKAQEDICNMIDDIIAYLQALL